ncbi:MAG TPA: peptidoglycan-binding domain-containing protein [Kofleriaceae bacterium]
MRDVRGRGDGLGIGRAGLAGGTGSPGPGKRTLTEALPVQARRAIDAPASEAAGPGLDGEDDDAGSTSHRSRRFDGDPDLAPVAAGTRQLARGDRGPAVRKIQLALRDMGYSTRVDGVFDGDTEDQVKALQRSGGAFDGGKVNQATMVIFERRFTMRTPYVEAARDEAPNLHLDQASGWGDKGWDAAHPPSALTRHTHTLSDPEKADALATLSPAARTMPAYGGSGYKAKLDPMLRDIVRKKAKPAHDKAKDHKDPRKLFSLDLAAQIGKHSKQAVDRVYGHWAAHKEFEPRTTLQDKFDAESKKIDGMTPDERFQLARDRLDYLWRTSDQVAALNATWAVDRSRAAEQADIDSVLDAVTRDLLEDLLAIQRAWPGSTSKGTVFVQLFKGKNAAGNRSRRWHIFATLVHEYLHNLANPAWLTFRRHVRDQDKTKGHTLAEGVTEFLTRNVLSAVDPAEPALRKAVEGDDYDADADPADDIDRGGGYQAEADRAEKLVSVVGVHNLYAAYFVGQTQLVGG